MKETEEMMKALKGLGIRESYYHLDDNGNLFYAFLAPGRKESDFEITHTEDLLTIKTEETTLSVRVRYYNRRFNLEKAQATYKDGTLIVKVPPKTRSKSLGKIKVGGA